MRDNAWLEKRLDNIWQAYFADVPKINTVTIKFGRRASTRLGSIIKRNKSPFCDSEITMTGFFKDERVPEYVIDLTIAHELCHYAHGFSSPLPQLSKYPHQGGMVDNELKKRGFSEGLVMQKKWLKEEWPKIVLPIHKRQVSRIRYRTRSKKQLSNIFDLLFGN